MPGIVADRYRRETAFSAHPLAESSIPPQRVEVLSGSSNRPRNRSSRWLLDEQLADH